MLTAVGLTLIFAAMTCALGMECYALIYRHTGKRRYWHGVWAQGLMMAWFFVCGTWALLKAAY